MARSKGYGLTAQAVRRLNARLAAVRDLAVQREGRAAVLGHRAACQFQGWVCITSTTQTLGRYPGLCAIDDEGNTLGDIAVNPDTDVVWVRTANDGTLTLDTGYLARLEGDAADGIGVYVVDDGSGPSAGGGGTITFPSTSDPTVRPTTYLILPTLIVPGPPTWAGIIGEIVCGVDGSYQCHDGWQTYTPGVGPFWTDPVAVTYADISDATTQHSLEDVYTLPDGYQIEEFAIYVDTDFTDGASGTFNVTVPLYVDATPQVGNFIDTYALHAPHTDPDKNPVSGFLLNQEGGRIICKGHVFTIWMNFFGNVNLNTLMAGLLYWSVRINQTPF